MVFRICKKKGFTLIELLVSVSIFVFITALLLAKYGNFNQGVLLTNLAYDIALTIRTAQTYGLSVQGRNASFQYPYGVDFCKQSCGAVDSITLSNKQIIFFTDNDKSGIFSTGDFKVSSYAIKRGAKILGFCVTDPCTNPESIDRVDISFMRPNPDAKICADTDCSKSYLKIIVQATDGGTRNIVIRKTGQVSVE